MPIALDTIAGYLDQPEVAARLQPLFLKGLNWGRPSGARRTLQPAPEFPGPVRVEPIAELGAIPVLRVDWPATSLPTDAGRRAVLRQLMPIAGDHLACYVTSDGRLMAFVFARARRNGKTELRTQPYAVGSPARTTVERLALLHFEFHQLGMFGPEPTAVLDRLAAAFDAETVSRQFFREYDRIFKQARGLIGGLSGDDAHLFTQTLFNRLMFIVFLERKGWLQFQGSRRYEEFIKNTSSSIQNGYLRFKRIYLDNHIIPDAPEAERRAIAGLVEGCLAARGWASWRPRSTSGWPGCTG